METIKAYTDIEQSRKLADILPLDSADMKYFFWENDTNAPKIPTFGYNKDVVKFYKETTGVYLPCWSLAALLEILDYPQLSEDKIGNRTVGWMVSAYPNNCRYDSSWYNNAVNACYEMIIRLNELKLL